MIEKQELPDWFPSCPYPEDIFPMTVEDLKHHVPAPNLRTAIAGLLMRRGWEVASEMIWRAVMEHITDLEEELHLAKDQVIKEIGILTAAIAKDRLKRREP